MSQHSSLRLDSVGAKHRNVLTRLERVKKLMEDKKEKEYSSAFGLPKVKSVKIKIKKVKEPKEGAAAQEGQAPAAPAAGQAKKPAA